MSELNEYIFAVVVRAPSFEEAQAKLAECLNENDNATDVVDFLWADE